MDSTRESIAIPNDIPPRTWRGWWLEWPKWLRIGVWAGLAGLLSHVFLVLRLIVGQIEDQDIRSFRQRGGQIHYTWLPDLTKERFAGEEWLSAGLWGKNGRYVNDLALAGATDADLQRISDRFPKLQRLILRQPDVTATGLAELTKLQTLWGVFIDDADVRDADVMPLTEIKSLGAIGLSETRVTDAILPHLQQMKLLRSIRVRYTDISRKAIIDLNTRGGYLLGHEKMAYVENELYGSFRWSDGRRNEEFPGAVVLEIDGPLITEFQRKTIRKFPEDGTPLTCHRDLHWKAADLASFPDGEYRFSLQLGHYEAEPVIILIEQGIPSVQEFEFRMPVTRKRAIGGSP